MRKGCGGGTFPISQLSKESEEIHESPLCWHVCGIVLHDPSCRQINNFDTDISLENGFWVFRAYFSYILFVVAAMRTIYSGVETPH
jgi:hypothetical protein